MGFYFSMTFTIIFIFAISYLSKNKYSKVFALILSSCVLLLVSGFRDFSVGSDTSSYINTFMRISSPLYNFSFEGYLEPGYQLYNYLIGKFTSNPQIFLLITSALIIASVSIFIFKNSTNYFMSIYLFITLMFFYSSMNITRQFLAVSIILLSFKFVKEEKLFKYILSVLIASLFHTSALISILIYYSYNLKFTFKRLVIFLLLTLLCFIILAPLLEFGTAFFPRYNSYFVSRFGDNNLASVLTTIMYSAILILGLYTIKNNKFNNTENLTNKEKRVITDRSKINYQGLTYIIVLAVSISFISIELNILNRMALYFTIFMIIYIPNSIDNITNKYLRLLVASIILIIISLYNIVIFIYRPEWHSVLPYQIFR